MSVTRVEDTFELHQRRHIEEIIDQHNEDMTTKTVTSPMERGSEPGEGHRDGPHPSSPFDDFLANCCE
eukprot:980694-Prorocentrum_minimum.AAC.1